MVVFVSTGSVRVCVHVTHLNLLGELQGILCLSDDVLAIHSLQRKSLQQK